MLLKDLVLNGLENLAQYTINGKPLNDKLYAEYADCEIEHWFVDVKKDGYCIEVKIEGI